jgi:glycosyltransferase involved in cell wall biosynthesis
MPSNSIELSIVIPQYNEVDNLQNGVLAEVSHHSRSLVSQGVISSAEIIIVDDRSTDGSYVLSKAFVDDNEGFRILQVTEDEGKGKAVAVNKGA